MRKFNLLFVIGVLFISAALIFSSGCKKATEDPTPTPTPTAPTFAATAIPWADDLSYIDIYAQCTTDDIILTKVTIKTPLQNTYIFNAGGATYLKGERMTFPEVYLRQSGKWYLTFVGNKQIDGTYFSSNASFDVSVK